MDRREDFCGICTAVPLAFAGFGAANSVNSKIGILIICALSVIVSIYFLIKYWGCSKCKG